MLRKTIWTLVVLSIPTASLAQDQYLCAKVRLEERFTLAQGTVADLFGSSAIDVRGVATLCGATTTSSNSDVQQVGYKTALSKDVVQASFERSDHIVTDEFGVHPVSLTKVAGLLAPSALALGGGGTSTTDTTGVDHFQCYKASRSSGAPKFEPPAPFGIEDVFGAKTISISKISKVCAPASFNGEDPTAPVHEGYLVCYRARLESGPEVGIVSINNTSFGPGVVTLKSVTEYCVPGTIASAP